MIRAFFLCALCFCLGSCSRFPDLGATRGGSATGPAPHLVPIDGLLAQAGPGRATAAARDGLAARAVGLRARAAAMRGPVHSPATRARLKAAVAAHPSLMN
ncbi:hypothetical protein [Pseudorhodobacter sp.]|uniref:hypothetical protein n=1 Tax=Pseudorhodobacter sp. TaxID=1934400 RepID=UPI0026484B8C|nr:hypothetical protein [Pseudorhodobacter sp.]MDN5787011.1 hypothetical protein [Pseudorhodobacter sp.]